VNCVVCAPSFLFSMRYLWRCSTNFPYTTLFRSTAAAIAALEAELASSRAASDAAGVAAAVAAEEYNQAVIALEEAEAEKAEAERSEEHTSELQSRENLVCRLLLEKKKHK